MSKLLVIGAAGLLLASSAATAAAYQFILSGDPVAASTAASHAAASSGTSLATGTLSTPGNRNPLEARFRTFDESDGTSLRSDKYGAFMIIVR